MFIVIDGPDGSGKTTLSKCLVTQLHNEGMSAIYTYEPTNDGAGHQLRNMIRTGIIPDVYAFSNLFIEDRKEHIKKCIQPAIDRGEIVVCDRYKYSALAYQQLQGVDANYLIEANRTFLIPDFVFILMPPDANLLCQRIAKRGQERDVFEKEAFLEKTLLCYKKLRSYFPSEKIFFLDASCQVEENIKKIKEIMNCPKSRL